MDNEKLATLVQAGQADILELWGQVKRFAAWQARRWAKASTGSGVMLDDLMQVAFLALVDAVETWNGGGFVGWYALKIKSHFTATTGQRTQRDRQDPLMQAWSLDVPLTDNMGEPFTLADVIEDEAAQQAIDDVAEHDRLHRLRDALESALATLPEPQRAAVVGRYCCGRKVDTRLCNAGMRALRHPAISGRLRAYL